MFITPVLKRKKMNRVYLPLLVSDGQTEFNEFLDNITARGWLDFRGFKRNAAA